MPHTRCEGSFLSMFQYCYRCDHTPAALMAPGSPLLSPKKQKQKESQSWMEDDKLLYENDYILFYRWTDLYFFWPDGTCPREDSLIYLWRQELQNEDLQRTGSISLKRRSKDSSKWSFRVSSSVQPVDRRSLQQALRTKRRNCLSISQLAKWRFTFNVRNNYIINRNTKGNASPSHSSTAPPHTGASFSGRVWQTVVVCDQRCLQNISRLHLSQYQASHSCISQTNYQSTVVLSRNKWRASPEKSKWAPHKTSIPFDSP